MKKRFASDDGAALIQVALSLIVLFLFSGFVIDYGTFWVARGQAQTVADSGALAGAVSRIFDDTTNPPASTTSGVVYNSVIRAGQRNPIWGQGTPQNTIFIDGYTCPDGTTSCVEVSVYRDGTNNSTPVPTFFLRLAGINSQGTRAHAVAEVGEANAVHCIKPWVVPDRFSGPDWPNGAYTSPQDTYIDPTQSNTTGYGTQDIGSILTLRSNTATPSSYQMLSLAGFNPGAGPGGYLGAIDGCTTGTYVISQPGDDCSNSPDNNVYSCVTVKPGDGPDFTSEVNAIIQQDPGASAPNGVVTGSCAQTQPGCRCAATSSCANGLNGTVSPRIVPVVIGDPEDVRPGRSQQIRIVNIFAFFLLPPVDSSTLQGVLVSTTGLEQQGGGSINAGNAFFKAAYLVR